MKKIIRHFGLPSRPSVRLSIRPSVRPDNSALRASRVNLPWTPKGHCRCLSASMIFKIKGFKRGREAPNAMLI